MLRIGLQRLVQQHSGVAIFKPYLPLPPPKEQKTGSKTEKNESKGRIKRKPQSILKIQRMFQPLNNKQNHLRMPKRRWQCRRMENRINLYAKRIL
jgi:hypothetical protein